MFAAHQKTKSSELLDELNRLSVEDKRNQFRLHAIKREAEYLTRHPDSSPEDFVALGAVNAYLNSYQDARRAFRNALARSPNDYYVLLNYATALDVLGRLDKAIEYAHEANQIRPGDLAAIDCLIRSYIHSAQFRAANDFICQWRKEKPNEPHPQSDFVEECVLLMDEYDVADETTLSFVRLGFDIVIEKDLPMAGVSIELLSDEYSKWITYIIKLDETLDDAFDYTLLLFDRLSTTTLASEAKGIFSIKFEAR